MLALEPGKAPIAAVIGLGWILGSAVLAWFSSPATLHLSRDNEDRVVAAIESRLFGLFTNRAARVEGIRSATLVPGTPDRIVFETAKGSVDLGRNQQLFALDYPEIDGFIKADAPPSLTLSSLARGPELRRFVIAQTATLFIFLVGLGLEWLVLAGLWAP